MECIVCGEREGEFKGLCGQCFLKQHAVMETPDYVNIVLCPHCGAMKRGEHWLDMNEPEAAVDRSVKESLAFDPEVSSADVALEIEQESGLVYRARVIAKMHIRGLDASGEAEVIARIEHRVCDVCSRLHGNYYESVVQLRGYSSKLSENEKEEWLETVRSIVRSLSSSNRRVFLAKSVEMHGGLDFYLSTTDAGRNVSRELARRTGASLKESKKLAGRKDGKDVYRTTYSVRLPPCRLGDYVVLDDVVYRVERLSKDRFELLRLRDGELVRMKRDVDSQVHVLDDNEYLMEAVVVFEGEKEIQILDPVNYKTVQIKKPLHYEPDEAVDVIRFEGDIFIA